MLNLLPQNIKRRNKKIFYLRFFRASLYLYLFLFLAIFVFSFLIFSYEKSVSAELTQRQKIIEEGIKALKENKSKEKEFAEKVKDALSKVKSKKESTRAESLQLLLLKFLKSNIPLVIKELDVDFGESGAEFKITLQSNSKKDIVKLLKLLKSDKDIYFADIPATSIRELDSGSYEFVSVVKLK